MDADRTPSAARRRPTATRIAVYWLGLAAALVPSAWLGERYVVGGLVGTLTVHLWRWSHG